MTEETIVRAVDVGYGYTKFTTNDGVVDGQILTQSFPSIALPSTRTPLQVLLDEKQTLRIQTGKGQTYEVGFNITSSLGPNYVRQLDLQFSESGGYLALTLAAVHYMQVPHLDYMVVGLPIHNFNSAAPALKDRLQRVHSLPNGKIEIRQVEVVPQPVGAMLDYGIRNQVMRQLLGKINLLIDPGYYTLDWLLTEGMTPNSARSGSATGAGMAAILSKTFSHIASHQRSSGIAEATESDLIRLDQAIRLNQEYRLYGKSIPLQDIASVQLEVIEGALRKLLVSVGGASDIDNVLIAGGGAAAYQSAVTKVFPHHDIRMVKDPAFANVRGFQVLGNKKAGLLNASKSAEVAENAE